MHMNQRVKKMHVDDDDGMSVIGFSCTLYEQQQHQSSVLGDGIVGFNATTLIQWMGDGQPLHSEPLMLDRFDGRMLLTNYGSFMRRKESNGDGVAAGDDDGDGDEDALCEIERYRDLCDHVDIDVDVDVDDVKKVEEEDVEEEAKFKRYACYAPPPCYDEYHRSPPHPTSSAAAAAAAVVIDDEPSDFECHLNVPVDMALPRSRRTHDVIEKTAAFVAEQGSQMEVMLKAKQAGYAAFAFLDFSHPLNAYFKHLVQLIKTKCYIPPPPSCTADEEAAPVSPAPVVWVTPPAVTSSVSSIGLVNYDSDDSTCIDDIESTAEDKSATGTTSENASSVDIRKIVEKVATYVAKNGDSFAAVVREHKRMDANYDFLNPSHILYPYYLECIERSRKALATYVLDTASTVSSPHSAVNAAISLLESKVTAATTAASTLSGKSNCIDDIPKSLSDDAPVASTGRKRRRWDITANDIASSYTKEGNSP